MEQISDDSLGDFGLMRGVCTFLGGLFADLILGQKLAIVFGGILLVTSSFLLASSLESFFLIGLTAFAVGSGFVRSNLYAIVGNLYPNRSSSKFIGYTILHLFVNLGSFVGMRLILRMTEVFGLNIGFLILGFGVLLSLGLLILQWNYVSKWSNSRFDVKDISKHRMSVFPILFSIFISGVFWFSFSSVTPRVNDIIQFFRKSPLEIVAIIKTGSILPVILGIPVALFWRNRFRVWGEFKATTAIGAGIILVAVAISFGILSQFSDFGLAALSVLVFLISLALAEMCFSPAVYSHIHDLSKGKFASTYIGLLILVSYFFTEIGGFFPEEAWTTPGFLWPLVGLLILLGYITGKKVRPTRSYDS